MCAHILGVVRLLQQQAIRASHKDTDIIRDRLLTTELINGASPWNYNGIDQGKLRGTCLLVKSDERLTPL
jgi:hypothetical protein